MAQIMVISVEQIKTTVKPDDCGQTSNPQGSYQQILKSSVLVGGSTFINILVGMFRTKVMALCLGPSGVGLMGLYTSILEVTQSVVGLGVNNSGVRQIACAVGSGQIHQVARTSRVLKRLSFLLGVLGGGLLALLAKRISVVTFGTHTHATGIALLGFAVAFRCISGGQAALLQGMRQISGLAKAGFLGATLGTLVSVPLVYCLSEQGIVPSLVAVAGMSIFTSWWYSRKLALPPVQVGIHEGVIEAAALLKLGFAFMASGFLTMGVAYAIRLMIVRKLGFDAAGLYQSAWALGGLYIGFILQAMAADFYPRLTAAVGNNAECNRLVNEQAQVSLLLAGPGVIATLAGAPLVLALFYSSRFADAVDILRWITLGMALRVLSWPMGFIVVAKNEQRLFFLVEVMVAVVHLGLGWLLIALFGLAGAGAAFFGLYVCHSVVIYFVVRRLSGFRWSAVNRKLTLYYLTSIMMVFIICYIAPYWLAIVTGGVILCISSAFSLRLLLNLFAGHRISKRLRSIFGCVTLFK